MRRSSSEHELVALAGLVWLAARLAVAVPLWSGLAVVVIAATVRSPKMLILAGLLVASSLGNRAEINYRQLDEGTFDQVGRLVTDPRPLGLFSWRAEFKSSTGERVMLRASGPAGWELTKATAGDQLSVAGKLEALPEGDWYKSRHLVGSVSVREIVIKGGPPWWQVPAELLRNGVNKGGELLGPDRSALYTGLVIGDDRFQYRSQQETFRAVGLAHLLAVSGQNVVFALAVASPFISRAGLRVGFLLTLCVLGWFAVATRLEPSVIRATVTAAIAAWSILRGTRATGVRVLSLAVVGAVLLDPFLVYSIGFSLSVLASGGILLGSEIIGARLHGPAWLKLPLAITLSAQLAVAPLLLSTFGPVASVSILANVAAGWAAGLVMAWGLSGGLIAAIVPETIGAVVQLPAGAAVWWIDFVATQSWRLPFPVFDGRTAAAFVGLLSALWLIRFQQIQLRLLVAGALVVVILGSLPATSPTRVPLAGGGTYWPATSLSKSVLTVDSSGDTRLIEAIVGERITSVDYLVFTGGGRSSSLVAAEVLRLVRADVVLAPPQHLVVGAQRLTSSAQIYVVDGHLILEPAGPDIVLSHITN